MTIDKKEAAAKRLYEANKEYVEKVSDILSIEDLAAFAKEQNRLYLIICAEQDERLNKNASRP